MKKTCICFAYFGDDKFLGWYGDSFGSIYKTPKIYSDTEIQLAVITRNFQHKLSSLQKQSELHKSLDALALVNAGLNQDKEQLLKYKEVELRSVSCPIYDGPNPDFDREFWENENTKRLEKMRELGILDIPGPSILRSEAVENFDRENPRPRPDNWIYADYEALKIWAAQEPTEFITIVKTK